jgi:phage terminase large subunit-like protein
VEVWAGSDAVLKASAYIRELIDSGRPIREIVYDPMRFDSEAQRLEADYGIPLVEWPQSETRMTRCSENLHRLVVEQRLRHPGVAELDRHVAAAVAKPTPRGWRLVKSSEVVQIDAVIALAMSAERAEYTPPVVQVLGWIG